MAELKIRTRAVGATAVLKPKELPVITSETGGQINVVTSVSEPGFNPLDLLYASLSACIVLSARIAASRLGVADRLLEVRAHVTGEKAHDEPSRVVRFNISIEIDGDLDKATQLQIVETAEEICTVSNTLRGNVEFVTKLTD
ncbi:OsmC family protein [Phyllobacterium zundukense]|uniref:Osmotically inducible protein OsmC n=1 Tax=Phyllobacterium zundukense TaxID=1867719 RepID=A0A2N9W503_9HYPH|nr:OsmC family protein [Phyllobacterium zundukense]ATU91714.1 osmotically inducible protein OsmC [Phyllobacterium zundukense]PIO46821.1 osmotically inducible protein OsmC [Phyllobacterium zundukense]